MGLGWSSFGVRVSILQMVLFKGVFAIKSCLQKRRMSGVEELDEWDADFLNQYIQVEERALTSSQHHHTQPPPPPCFLFSQPLQQQQQHQPPWPSSSSQSVTHSPPRELTQRTTNLIITHSPPPPSALPSSAADKQLEIDRLKEELGLVRQKLSHLEQECSELREKDKQHKNVTSRNEKKDAAFPNPESTHFNRGGRESGDIVLVQKEDPRRFQNSGCSCDQPGSRIDIGASKSKSAGIQTDQTIAPAQAMPNSDLHAYDGLSKKLLDVWESPNEQELGRNLISNLLMACQTDFRFLFGSVGMMSSKLRMDQVGDDSSSVAASQYHFDMSHTPEASKVSHIFSVLTEVKNGMLNLEALFQPLVNLCSLRNVIIVKASLHILHVFLKHLLSLERPFERRDNIIVEGLCCKNMVNPHGFEGAKKGSYPGSFPLGMECSDSKTQRKNGVWNNGIATWLSRIDWISLFDIVLQTAMENTEQGVRLEAVSILNMIIMRSNAFSERENFSQTPLFEILARLLAKEAGFEVQKQAVHLLYMLLNCPKILVKFCSDYEEGKGAGANGAMDGNAGDALAYQKISMTLQELANCIACCGNSLEELKLSRNAILVLAFLASSGKSGFEILVSHELCQDANFLMLILQVLASDVDTEVAVHADQAQVFKERTLLIREALILLNRLVSNPAYSGTVLRLLTSSRDMACLTIEVANELSRKDQISKKFSGIARQMWESEIVDLARVFKKRVFTYLGDNIS